MSKLPKETRSRLWTTEKINDVVCDIMMNCGPDGHVDGHEIITGFVVSLLAGNGKQWVATYEQKYGPIWPRIG